MAETREHKYPVGTIRRWEVGDVIKAHDNSIFNSGWILMTDLPSNLEKMLLEMDDLSRKIIIEKKPIDGELWLEKEINEFNSPTGAKYTLNDFMQYSGAFGAGKYSFRNEFSKRFLGDKIQLQEKIDEALLNANMSRGSNGKTIVLSKEEIKSIRDRVKKSFIYQYDANSVFSEKDMISLHETLKSIYSFFKDGITFEEGQKEIFDSSQEILNTFTDNYERYGIKRDLMNSTIAKMEETFADNWGVKESFRKQFFEQWDKYIEKYQERIEADELEDFKKKLGCNLDAPFDVFYKALDNSGLIEKVNLNDYIGKQVPSYHNEYEDVTLISIEEEFNSYTNKNEYYPVVFNKRTNREEKVWSRNAKGVIEKMIAKRKGTDINLPMQLRFNSLYGKSLTGSWSYTEIEVLKSLEKLFGYLPEGHFLTNSQLKNIAKDSLVQSHSGYAHYNSQDRKIFLSDKALDTVQEMTSFEDGHEFASVMIHEIGHAVSFKLGRKESLEYKKFGYECGWSWDELRGKNYTATDGDKDITRSKVTTPLITKYSYKSPEEAFAEYYSFYSQHRNKIDKFLETKDSKFIKSHSSTLFSKDSFHSEKNNKLSDYSYLENTEKKQDEMKNVLLKAKRDIEESFTINVIKPTEHSHEIAFDKMYSDNEKRERLRQANNYLKKADNPYPVFTVIDKNGSHTVVDEEDSYYHYMHKFHKVNSLAFSINRDSYEEFKKSGFSDGEIKRFASTLLSEKQVPTLDDLRLYQDNKEEKMGLRFRYSIVPHDIISKNYNTFNQMKKIWESEELKKAIEELLGSSVDTNETIQISGESTMKKSDLINRFKKYILNPILNKSEKTDDFKNYADCVVISNDNKLLILQRSGHDDFQPSKWCLPGGKIEQGETSEESAVRELVEETNLMNLETIEFTKTVNKEDCTIHYYFIQLDDDIAKVILDNEEHYQYAWIDPYTDLSNYDFLFDLKEQLEEMFDVNVDNDVDVIKSKFNEYCEINPKFFDYVSNKNEEDKDSGELNDVTENHIELLWNRFSKINEVKKSFANIVLAFDQGSVCEEKFLEANIKYNEFQKAVEENPESLDDTADDTPVEDEEVEDNENKVHEGTGHDFDKLKEYAKKSSLEDLEVFVKTSEDSELRKIAHEEIHRRTQEEHVQEDGLDDADKKVSESFNDSTSSETSQDEYEKMVSDYLDAKNNNEDISENPFLQKIDEKIGTRIEEKKKQNSEVDDLNDKVEKEEVEKAEEFDVTFNSN